MEKAMVPIIPSEPMGFISACFHFFGKKNNPDGSPQTLGQFSTECKQLTDKDRDDLKEGLTKIGYTFK